MLSGLSQTVNWALRSLVLNRQSLWAPFRGTTHAHSLCVWPLQRDSSEVSRKLRAHAWTNGFVYILISSVWRAQGPLGGRQRSLALSVCHLYAVGFSCLRLIRPKWKGLQRITLQSNVTFSTQVCVTNFRLKREFSFQESNKDTCAPSSGGFHFYTKGCICLLEAQRGGKKKNQSIKVIKITNSCGIWLAYFTDGCVNYFTCRSHLTNTP